ncbi:aldehyde dehydrogenase family protein [Sphingomonas montanisoli]|uniref:Aldehyde dehydrogenase family protein n=1 Tax=Sphingomonas montanisoli TaxID=2606412 RepID=A0A5D9CB86_9SPHN|nr:aldehyde dehydrogenase family protein [Sphingomonas montanisoli]TZG27381.1 aldehyde dehydrogenase family protein [Sphingomonas montanisoli]
MQSPTITLAEQTSQYIDGAFVAGKGATFTVENPADQAVIATIAEVSVDQVGEAIDAARRAYDSGPWGKMTREERVTILRRYADALAKYAGDITDVVVAEAGCLRNSPIMFAQVPSPLQHAHDILDLMLALPEMEENPLPLRERANAYGMVSQSMRRYTPIGVVAAIAAYNYPFMTALWKVMPALATGNTVILRPSPLTPISALFFAKAAEDAGLPAGVVNVVLEHGLEGARLMTTHKSVDMVVFTGSTAVGKQVMIQAADTMKRLQLELGGKSVQLYLPDSIDQAGNAAATVCFAHSGQGCALGTRILVPEADKPAVLEAMKKSLANVVLGDTLDPKTTMGPVISAAQVARCEHFVKLATDAGAKVVAGGKRPAGIDKGYFFEPTVLDVADNSNPAAQEEIFGPVVCVIGYRDLDHAVEIANDSDYGLSGFIYGKDRAKAVEVATRIKSGTVNVNGGMLSAFASSGGQRLSGIGRERGIEGLRLYQQVCGLNIIA